MSRDFVILASFDSRHAAEHMLASLGRGFRKKARKGHASAVVVSGNADGSLEVTQSRVLTASGVAGAIVGISISWTVGLIGVVATLRGVKGGVHAARAREGHTGAEEHRAHEILAEAGPRAALVFVRCAEPELARMVLARAKDRGRYCWNGSLTEFLADLNPGSEHDWIRAALGEAEPADGTPAEE